VGLVARGSAGDHNAGGLTHHWSPNQQIIYPAGSTFPPNGWAMYAGAEVSPHFLPSSLLARSHHTDT
jgi:hypothetical protein